MQLRVYATFGLFCLEHSFAYTFEIGHLHQPAQPPGFSHAVFYGCV